jgi:glucan biosynthesis protein C
MAPAASLRADLKLAAFRLPRINHQIRLLGSDMLSCLLLHYNQIPNDRPEEPGVRLIRQNGGTDMGEKASTRLYYLDWLRVLAILTVFVYHSTRFFNVETWNVKNPTWYRSVEVWNRFATAWLLPLIFVISGASLFFAVGKGGGGIKGTGKFIRDKTLRLLVPVVVCAFTHASLQAYLDRLTHGEFSGSYFQYLPNYFFDDFDAEGAHLWYLWVLFLFSVILYPLLLWLRGRGRGVLSKLGDLLALPGAVYALALPAILLVVLFDYNSAVMEHNAGWAFIVYLWLTLAGFLVVSDERLQASFQRLRWLSLALGLLLAGSQLVLLSLDEGPAFGTWRYALGWGTRALGSWCCVLAALGFGRKHLNFGTPFLRYANEAVLPFYILHQTVLLCVGYFVVQWAIPDPLKWAIILLVSFPVIMVLYEVLVRRFNIMRFLFGMKPLVKQPAEQRGDVLLAR